jgi:Golgi CORVET complex core vacuolar protein 8
MDEIESYDPKLLEEILYDGHPCPENYDVPAVTKYNVKFTRNPPESTSDDSEKLEKLLLGQHLSPKKSKESYDPLDLIQIKELQDMSSTEKVLNAYLNDKRQYQISRLPSVRSQNLKDLSEQLSAPTVLKITSKLLIIGNAYGLISIYTHQTYLVQSLQSPKVFGSVTSLDMSIDEQFLISGYLGGQICLWDAKSGASIRSNNSYHTASITSFKFWKGSNLCISSDISGKVMLIEYVKNFLSTGINGSELLKGEIGPVCDIQVLYSETKNHPLDGNSLIAIAGYKAVLIYSLHPEIFCMYTVPRPQSLKDSILPCISWKYALFDAKSDYSLSIGWGNAIVTHTIKFPIPEGIELINVSELQYNILYLVWATNEILIAITDRRQILLKINENKVICEYNTGFELVNLKGICKGAYGSERQVFLMGSKEFCVINLLTWSECIDELSGKGEWLEVLSFGLDLYNQNYSSQYGKPETTEELRNILEQLVTIYVKVGTIDWVHKITNTIEFCVEIDALDILFNMLLDFFIDHGIKENMDFFVNSLEPYILSGKIKKIPDFVIGKIVTFYLRNDTPEVIEKILLNLELSSINSAQILPIIKEYKLLSAGIWIYSNSDSYLEPLEMIYQAFSEEKDIIKKKYYYYKLLWYIRLTFQGKRFLGADISTEGHSDIVNLIVTWLKADVLEVLIKQDIVCLLRVMWQLFENGHKEHWNDIIYKLYNFTNGSGYSFEQFCCFVGKAVSLYDVALPLDVTLGVSYYFLNIKLNIENIPIGGSDILSYINNITYGEQDRLSFTDFSLKDIGKVLLKMLKLTPQLPGNNLESLLKLSEESPHTLVTVYLLDLKKDYIKSLKTLLNSDEKECIFDWLDSKFKIYTQKDLKNEVMDILSILVEIDSDKTAHLVKDWYQNSHGFIIKKLDNAPILQLKYLGELLKDQFDKDLVLKYVKLMCEHSPDGLLKFLKSSDFEYYDECLKICREFEKAQYIASARFDSNHVIQAQAYLNEKLGGVKESLDLWIGSIQATRLDLIQKMRKKEVIQAKSISELGKKIEKYGKVCIRNTEALDSNEIEEFWFCIFRNTLDCYVEFKEFFYLYPQLEPILHSSIKGILSNMLEHVDLSQIISCISSEYDDFPFKHLRDNMIDVFFRRSHQKKILQLAVGLLKADTAMSMSLLYSSRLKGHASDFFLCRSCGKKINGSVGDVFIFACGHVYHKRCQEFPACLLCN